MPISTIIGVLVLISVSLLQKRYPFLAAITSSMPVMVPITLWMLLSDNGNNSTEGFEYTSSLVIGVFATLCFVLGCLVALSYRLDVWLVFALGWSAWLLVAFAGWFYFGVDVA